METSSPIEVDPYPEPCATTSGKSLHRTISGDGKPQTVAYFPRDQRSRRIDLGLLDFSSQSVPETTLTDLDPLQFERLRQTITRLRGDQSLLELSDEELARRDPGSRSVPNWPVSCSWEEKRLRRVCLPMIFRCWMQTANAVIWSIWRRALPLAIGEAAVSPVRLAGLVFGAVNNAVLHRDLTQMQAVYVQWQPDHLLITNPGGFPAGVTLDNLLVHEPKPRNPRLAEAFRRIAWWSGEGRG